VAALLSLLNVADQSDGNKLGILSYVAATSRLKSNRSLGRDPHNNSFFADLLEITPSRAKQSARPFPDRQHVHPTSTTRDAAFLEALSAPLNEDLFQLSTIGIPHLMAIARAYEPGMEVPRIYTAATCEDVHRLLCHLLRCYDASLTTLINAETRPPVDVIDQFEIAVYGVATCGLTLRALAHTSFIDEHMYRILHSGPRSRRRRGGQDWTTAVEESNSGAIPTEINPGSDNGSPFVRHPYANWLRSLVEHFEAADELIRIAPRIRSAHISVEIVAIPDCGTSMRPWKVVVKEIICSSIMTQSFKFSEQDAIEAIESLASRNPSLEKRLKGDMSLGQNFRGFVHAQTCLASTVHSYNSSERSGLVSFCCIFLCIYLIPYHS
jgi:hypothetical protein